MFEICGQISGTDTLFAPGELHYYSDLERASFSLFFDADPDYLSLITSVNLKTTEREVDLYREWLDEMAGEIRSRKFDELNGTRKIQRIRYHLEKVVLIHYHHLAAFDDLFITGTYNNLTAAAAYAFILERCGIPFEIHETPETIFLLAYPGDQEIEIVIDTPAANYFTFDHEVRESFVEYLYETGSIDPVVFNNTSNRDLFEKYYYTQYPFGIRDVVGLLYLNSGVKYMGKDQWYDAYNQFEKAFILHPSYKSQYLLLGHLGSFLDAMDYENTRDLGFLVKAYRLIGFGVEKELVRSYFIDIVNTILAREEDRKTFDYIRDYLYKYIPDTMLTKEFEFLALYEYGRLEYEDARFREALVYLEDAFHLFPDNEDMQNLLVRALAGYAGTVSPAVILEKIEEYDTAYTELESEDVLTLVKVHTYLSLLGQSFQLQDQENGEKYMDLFEELAGRHPATLNDHIQIGKSYSSAAIYYYRAGMIEKSKAVLVKGLKYAPGNIDLKLKLSAFE